MRGLGKITTRLKVQLAEPSASGVEILLAREREVARALSAELPENRQVGFAHSFAHTVVRTCWGHRQRARAIMALPESIRLTELSSEALAAAERFGDLIAELEPSAQAYAVGTLYATALPERYRAARGIFYTPPQLVDRLLSMAENAGVAWKTAHVLDPACGGGAFLLPVALRMVAALSGTNPAFILQQLATRLRGFDVDPFGAWLAQAMIEVALDSIAEAAGRPAPAIVEMRDSLSWAPEHREKYDLVIGNPPYGRVSLSPELRKVFARSVYGHANLYGLFTDAALHWAKRDGIIAYVTPTSMLSGLYYKALRGLLASNAPPCAINIFGERDGVFADVLQETMLATYRRNGFPRGGSVGFVTIANDGRASFRSGGPIVLPRRADAPWLLPRMAAQARLTRRLRAMPHRLADYGYGVSTGPLVWNRFKAQLRHSAIADSHPVIWAESVTSDGRFVWRCEKRNHAPWFAAKRPKDDWLIVEKPCVLLQRTTAKEQARRLIAAELPEDFIRTHNGVTIENHLNMVRAISSGARVPAGVIAMLLNSAAVDSAFRCINGSVAVSAFELEELPLPSPPVMARLAKQIATGAPAKKIEATIAAAYRATNAAAS